MPTVNQTLKNLCKQQQEQERKIVVTSINNNNNFFKQQPIYHMPLYHMPLENPVVMPPSDKGEKISNEDQVRATAVQIYRKQLDELINEKPQLTPIVQSYITNLSNNREIFTSEEFEYIPRLSEHQQLNEFKETLIFASFNINKMSDTNKHEFINFIKDRMYKHLRTPCVWIVFKTEWLNDYSMCFLIYRKNTYEITSISFVKEIKTLFPTPKLKKIKISYFCNYIDQKKDEAVDMLAKLYPYKGLGNQLMDKLQARLKLITENELGNDAKIKLELASTFRGERFYKKKGFKQEDYNGYFTKTYKKYLKYKDKYMKLKNLMTKN